MSEEKRNDAQTEKGTSSDSGDRPELRPSTTGGAQGDAKPQRDSSASAARPGAPKPTSKPAKEGTGRKADNSGQAKASEPASADASATTPAGTPANAVTSAPGGDSPTPNRASGAAGAPPPTRADGGEDGGRPHRAALIVAIIAIVMAVIAMIGVGWLWQRGEQKLASLDSRVATMEQSVQSNVQKVVMPRLSKIDQRLQSLAGTDEQQARRLAGMKESLSAMQQSVQAAKIQSTKLADRIDGNTDRWGLEQIEALLRAANERLQLYRDPEGARRALQLASDAIGRKGDPRLFKIRSRIVNEIAALRALPDPDIEGLSLQLAAMVKQVPDLPLASSVPGQYEQGTASKPAPGDGPKREPGADDGSAEMNLAYLKSEFSEGWAQFKESVGNALSGMLTIRRADGTQRALLPPDQVFFLNQNLQLQLRTARLALLERNTQGYRDSLASARQWLSDYYDTSVPAVSSMRDQLDQMRSVKLDWEAPDISTSLAALRKQLAKRQSDDGGASDEPKDTAQASDDGQPSTAAQSGDDAGQGGQ